MKWNKAKPKNQVKSNIIPAATLVRNRVCTLSSAIMKYDQGAISSLLAKRHSFEKFCTIRAVAGNIKKNSIGFIS